MLITKKNQVEHKIIKLDRFRRSSTKLLLQNEQNEPIALPFHSHHPPQANQLQFQDKPIQYYTNNNFIYNNVSQVQFPQPFIESGPTKEIPLNKSKSISFITYNTQGQNELQNESEVNGNMLLLKQGCVNSNYVYNKTFSKVIESGVCKSKQNVHGAPMQMQVRHESKWNMMIMPCKNENMEIVREVNEVGYNTTTTNNTNNTNTNNKENSTMFQTEHSQLIIENTPSRTNTNYSNSNSNNNGQVLLKEIYESGNDEEMKDVVMHKEDEYENELELFKGDVNYGKITFGNCKLDDDNGNYKSNIININDNNNKDISTPTTNERTNNTINILPMRNLLPFNKSIPPLLSNTNPPSSINTSSSHHSKIITAMFTPSTSSQTHHASPSFQIPNLKRFNTERSNTNSISNNFLLETISFNHNLPKATINSSTLNANSKQIRAIILKESISEINNNNKHHLLTEGNKHINTYSNVNSKENVLNNNNCVDWGSLNGNCNRMGGDDGSCLDNNNNNNGKVMKKKDNGNRMQFRNERGGGKGKSFLTPKGNENDKKNILFPSFLKNDKIAIMKYKNLLKNTITTTTTTTTSTPCAANNNNNNTKVIKNTQQTKKNDDNNNNNNIHNNNLSKRDKKQTTITNTNTNITTTASASRIATTTSTSTTKTSSRHKCNNVLNNKAKYQNVINSFYSPTDIPRLSYKHSFVESKRTGLNIFTKLALPANNFDNDNDLNSNYIHL